MPSLPTMLGLLVGIAAVVIWIATGTSAVAGVVLMIAVLGWLAFVIRDAIRRRRAV